MAIAYRNIARLVVIGKVVRVVPSEGYLYRDNRP